MRATCLALLLLAANILAYAGGAFAWHFARNDDWQGWTAANFRQVAVHNGAVTGLTKPFSFLYSPPLTLEAGVCPRIIFTARSSVAGYGNVYFRHADEGLADARAVPFTLFGDGQFHQYAITMSANPHWKGVIAQVRLDLGYLADTRVGLRDFRFSGAPQAGLLPNGNFFDLRADDRTLPADWTVTAAHGACAVSDLPGRGRILTLRNRRTEPARLATAVAFDRPGPCRLAMQYRGQGSLRLQLHCRDILGQPLPGSEFRLPPGPWRPYAMTFRPPALAASGEVEFIIGRNAELTLCDVRLLPSDSPPLLLAGTGSAAAGWTAHWIWRPETPETDRAPVYFRRTFSISSAPITQARVLITADNLATVYINGIALPHAPNYGNLRVPDLYNIAPYLRTGLNVLGVEAINTGGPAGLLAEAGIQPARGTAILLRTDASWQCAGAAPEGWSRPDFTPHGWTPAAALGAPPAPPWGTLPYRPVLPGPLARVTLITAPAIADPGETVALRLTMQLPSAVPEGLLSFELARTGEAAFVIPWHARTVHRPSGGAVVLRPRLALPRFLPAGAYQLRISLDHAGLAPVKGLPGVSDEDGILTMPLTIRAKPGDSPSATIAREGGSPVLRINGTPHTLAQYMTQSADRALIDHCRRNGLHLYWVNLIALGERFSAVDALCGAILARDPQACLLLNVPLDGINQPELQPWTDTHPNEQAQNAAGETTLPTFGAGTGRAPSLSSLAWQAMAEDLLRRLIRHVRGSNYAARVIGYAPLSGVSWEWQRWGDRQLVDYSAPAQAAFRAWAARQYGDDLAALNRAWKTTYLTFDDVRIPGPAMRLHTDIGDFLDPQRSQALIDYHRHASEVVAEAILRLARAVKEETEGTALCGMYYGYVTSVTGPYYAGISGHYALRTLLAAPEIDFLMSPSLYSDRTVGGASGFMTATDSLALHGKLWIDQADLRTLHARVNDGIARTDTLADSASVMLRHFANALINGCAEQWYDFSLGWTGGDARLMQLAGAMRRVEAEMQFVPRRSPAGHTAIAVLVDEQSTYYTGLTSRLHLDTVSGQYPELARTGVGFDTYLLDDLERMPDYRCYLFLNTFRITPKQQAYIDRRLKRGGKILIFVHAPGFTDGKQLSTERMSAVTGIHLAPAQAPLSLRVQLLPAAGTIGMPLPLTLYGPGTSCSPAFTPTDGEPLGLLEGDGRPGLALKHFPQWTSVYSSAPMLPAPLLRALAARAGITVVNPIDDDVTLVGDGLVAVHTAAGGRRVLTFPTGATRARDLFGCREYSLHGGALVIDLPPRSTTLFRYR